MRLDRVASVGGPALFAIGRVTQVEREWAANSRSRASAPPAALFRPCMHRQVAPTLISSSSGALWDVCGGAPLDVGQKVALMGLSAVRSELLRLVPEVTETQLGQLLEQGVHATAAVEAWSCTC